MSFWSDPFHDIGKVNSFITGDFGATAMMQAVSNNQDAKATTGAIAWDSTSNSLNAATAEDAALRAKEIELGLAPNSLVGFKKFFIDPSQATGDLLRRQDADYRSTYGPIEDRLLGMTSYKNPGVANDEIAKAIGTGSLTRGQFMSSANPALTGAFQSATGASPATGYVQKSMDNAYGQGQRSYQRYGMAPSARQQAAIDKNDTMKRSTAVVDAANTIRSRVADRDNQIMLGMAPTSGGRTTALKAEA